MTRSPPSITGAGWLLRPRPQRPGETDGSDYHFVDPAGFDRLVAEGAFLEWAVYNDQRYGTSWAAVDEPLGRGHDVLLEIEVQGARQVRERRDDARFVFLLPPGLGALRERLERRGTDTPEEIERRLRVARRELEEGPRFDYAVANDRLEDCVERVLEILAAERRGDTAALRARHAPAPAVARLLQQP